MELFQIKCLVKAVDSGSIRAAARALAVSAPTVLKAISVLEAEFGGTMLIRGSKGVRPTELGNLVLEHGRAMLEAERRALDAARTCVGQRQQIRISATEAPAALLLPDVVAELRSRIQGQLDIRLLAGGYILHRDRLRRGEIDLMISPLPQDLDDAGIRCTPLYRNRSVLVGPADSGLSDPVDLRDLERATWVVMSPADEGPGASVLQTFTSLGLTVPGDVIRSESNAVTLKLLQRLQAYALIPEPLVPGDLETIGLRRFSTRQPLATHSVYIISLRDLIPNEKIELAINIIRKHAAWLIDADTSGEFSRPVAAEAAGSFPE